jgi:hypothetical protein
MILKAEGFAPTFPGKRCGRFTQAETGLGSNGGVTAGRNIA